MFANEKLISTIPLDPAEKGGVKLHFEDNSTETFDALMGAHDILANVRSFVLGTIDSGTAPLLGGRWDFRNLVPTYGAKERP